MGRRRLGPGRRVRAEAHSKKRDHEDEEAQVQITANEVFLLGLSGDDRAESGHVAGN